jgi:peptide/nickel transport system permease protein
MLALVVRRVVATVPILLITSAAIYLLVTVNGNAAVTLAGGESATPQQIAQVKREYHLDDPFIVQYGRWLWNASHLDLGTSLFSHETVISDLQKRFPVTLSLVLASLVLGLLIGIPLGIISGVRRGSAYDHSARAFASLGVAVPSFCLAIGLVVGLAVYLRVLPPAGYVSLTDDPLAWARYMLLPAATLGVGVAAVVSRQLRGSVIDVLESQYIRAVWARGAGPGVVIWKHVLRNAATTPLTVLGVHVGYLLGGTVIVEQIFAIPGLGQLMLRAVVGADLPIIMALTVLFVLGQVTISLLVDVAYGFVNPKVRGSSG